MAKSVTMVSKDGKYERECDNPVEVTQYRALGWTVKGEKKSEKKADAK
jgi:hypothetical protein